MAKSALQAGLEDSNFSETVKVIDAELQKESEGEKNAQRLQQLYFNRGWCYQQLDLNRKALKDFNEAIKLGNPPLKVPLHRGQVLWALGKKQVKI